jgi:hypothetical protein
MAVAQLFRKDILPSSKKFKEGTMHGISFKRWNNTNIMVIMTLLAVNLKIVTM